MVARLLLTINMDFGVEELAESAASCVTGTC